jgi:hypothetical protein
VTNSKELDFTFPCQSTAKTELNPMILDIANVHLHTLEMIARFLVASMMASLI